MKTLITTLGRGQFNKETKEFDYFEASYALPDGKTYRTKLVARALVEYLKPDEVYVVGTSESLWKLADSLIGNYKRVEIPYGKSHEEFWEMFRKVYSIDVEGKELYLDITHGFRSIPLMTTTMVSLFTKVKGAHIRGVYYGIYEAKSEDRTVPIIDLLPFIELNEWIEGFTLLTQYGDGLSIAELIKRKAEKYPDRKSLGKINSLPKVLEKFSQAVSFNALELITKSTKDLINCLQDIKELPTGFEALELLKDAILQEALKFSSYGSAWEKQLKLVRWLFEKRRYSEAIIALEETIFTYIMEKLGKDYLENSRQRLGAVFREDCEKHKVFTKEANDLFSRIQELRNKTGHAFMKKSTSEGDIREAINNLGDYIRASEELLKEERFIKDITALGKALEG